MIKSFTVVNNIEPANFIKKVVDALSGRELGKIANMSLAENEIMLSFSKLGKSEIIYSVTKVENGFTCNQKSEKIALIHRPMRKEMEEKFAKVLEDVGAKIDLA